MTQPVKTFSGADFVGADGKPVELTLLSVIENSLLGEQSPSEETKRSNYILVLTVHKNAADLHPPQIKSFKSVRRSPQRNPPLYTDR